MSFLLWIGEAADEAIDLGDPFQLFSVFAEMARVAGRAADCQYNELYSVPQFGEQEVDSAWLKLVRTQARAFLAKHGRRLSDHPCRILEALAQETPIKDNAMATRPKPAERARRKNVLRRDCAVGAAEREIARVFGLPEGCIRLINPDGRKARSDKLVRALLVDWNWDV